LKRMLPPGRPFRRPRRYRSLFLACCLLFPIAGNGASDQTSVMAEAMLKMMEGMGLFGNADSWRDMAESWRGQGGTIWDQDTKKDTGEKPEPVADDHRLNGIWMGRAGEWLLIRAPYFRLLSGRGQQVDGMLRLRGKLLSMYLSPRQEPQRYEFAEDQGRLVLRDRNGNLFLYRRQQPKTADPSPSR
jgi:hypothetical protein